MQAERNKQAQLLFDMQSEKELLLAAIFSLEKAALSLNETVSNLVKENPFDSIPAILQPKATLTGKKSIWPVNGKILHGYGAYKDRRFKINGFRSGIEFSSDRGEPIHAVRPGKVLFADWFKGYGNMIIVDHGDHYYTVYAHAEELFKTKGDFVETKEVIATVGDSGSLTGPGLYFEVRHHGKPIDPAKWLRNG